MPNLYPDEEKQRIHKKVKQKNEKMGRSITKIEQILLCSIWVA